MRLALILVVGCGGAPAKPAPTLAPAKPAPVAPAPSDPAKDAAIARELKDLATQNATTEGGIKELQTNLQTLDDSEDPIASRRTQLQQLEARRGELATAAAATRKRADDTSNRDDIDGDTRRAATDERTRAEHLQHDLEDLKARLGQLDARLDAEAAKKPAEPAPTKKKK